MISRFIAVPRAVQFLTRCTSVAQFSTNRGTFEPPTQQTESKSSNVKFNAFRRTEKKEPLPNYPEIEGIKHLELESFLVSNFQKVKYGDYEFTECKEGYVQVHIQGYCDERDPSNRIAAYGICYGKDHPLNSSGPVIGKQTEAHANIYAAAQALKSLPKGLFTKVCICTDSTHVVTVACRLLPQWSENNYRMISDPMRRIENLPTVQFINEYVRLNPFTYRFKYTPSDCYITMMVLATKLAKAACSKVVENTEK